MAGKVSSPNVSNSILNVVSRANQHIRDQDFHSGNVLAVKSELWDKIEPADGFISIVFCKRSLYPSYPTWRSRVIR